MKGWEKFTWIDLGNHQFGLFGHSGFVCGEGGNGASLICNRPALGGWERFLWTEEVLNAIPTINKSNGIIVYNRTLKNTESTPKDISVYNYMGSLVSKLTLHGNSSTELNLSKGYYILNVNYEGYTDQVKVILK